MTPWPGWIAVLGGIWLFIAGFVSGVLIQPGLGWNDVLVGIGALIVGSWAIAAARPSQTAAAETPVRHAA